MAGLPPARSATLSLLRARLMPPGKEARKATGMGKPGGWREKRRRAGGTGKATCLRLPQMQFINVFFGSFLLLEEKTLRFVKAVPD